MAFPFAIFALSGFPCTNSLLQLQQPQLISGTFVALYIYDRKMVAAEHSASTLPHLSGNAPAGAIWRQWICERVVRSNNERRDIYEHIIDRPHRAGRAGIARLYNKLIRDVGLSDPAVCGDCWKLNKGNMTREESKTLAMKKEMSPIVSFSTGEGLQCFLAIPAT